MCQYNTDWYYYQYEKSQCESECSITCRFDSYYNEYCCPLAFSTRHNSSGPWWIAIIFAVIFILAFSLSCWQMQMRRKRMLMMMNAQQRIVMGNGVVAVPGAIQPAVIYQQPMQQPQQMMPQMQMMPQNYPSNMPMSQNSQISMPAVM
ncbi:Hypothetical_protein [Hexamita inflata]|uniref:Hypothetical_protein n=1 Tax=Hexamita inflata TaxID=28002 RepID=A0AA86PLQ5_9EUKA|nr:Hypothetical protein HINF_LOCUS28511 [Hexamita inflata]